MGSEQEKTPRKRMKLTGEYLGGLIAGFGFGISLMYELCKPDNWLSLMFPVGLFLMFIGTNLAYYAQGKYEHQETKQT